MAARCHNTQRYDSKSCPVNHARIITHNANISHLTILEAGDIPDTQVVPASLHRQAIHAANRQEGITTMKVNKIGIGAIQNCFSIDNGRDL